MPPTSHQLPSYFRVQMPPPAPLASEFRGPACPPPPTSSHRLIMEVPDAAVGPAP